MSLIQENEANINPINHQKYKEYRYKWIQQNKDKLNLYAVNQYKKKINNDPTYREQLNEKAKKRYHDKIKKDGEPVKRGRPKKIIDGPIIKKAIGRPKKY